MTDAEKVDIRVNHARDFAASWPENTGPREVDGAICFNRHSRMVHLREEVLLYHEEFRGQVIALGHPGAALIYRAILRI